MSAFSVRRFFRSSEPESFGFWISEAKLLVLEISSGFGKQSLFVCVVV